MSIYFANTPDDTRKSAVSTVLKERGLEYLRAKPSSIPVVTFVQQAQPAYVSYVQHIHAFIHATTMGTNVCTSVSMIQLVPPKIKIPFTMPNLIYDYATKLTERRVTELTKLGSQVHQRGRKGHAFLMNDPTVEKVTALMKEKEKPDTKTRHISGTMNINAYRSVLVIQNLLSAFLMTHVYPAFRTKDALDPGDDYEMESGSKKRKRKEPYLTSISTREGKKSKSDPMDVEEEKDGKDPKDLVLATIALQRAKPTRSKEQRWGLSSEIPNADGLFFPYVSDLAVYDESTVLDVINRYFVRTLANNAKAAVSVLESLRSSWGILKETEMGKEASHMFKCVDIALRSQTALYPVFTTTRKYEGCVMWGAGCTISVDTKIYEPVSYDKLCEHVRDSSMHSKALSDIEEALVGESEDVFEELRKCTSIRRLSRLVQRCQLDVVARKKIVDAANRLCYDNRYWSCQPGFIKKAFNLYDELDHGGTISDDVPMHPSVLFSCDKDSLVLSAFGYQAPTFIIPNGKVIKLDSKIKDRDIMTNFYVRPIKLSQAVTDMRFVRENKTITNNNNSLASKHRETSLNGEDKRMIYRRLVLEVMKDEQQDAESSESEDSDEDNVKESSTVLDVGF